MERGKTFQNNHWIFVCLFANQLAVRTTWSWCNSAWSQKSSNRWETQWRLIVQERKSHLLSSKPLNTDKHKSLIIAFSIKQKTISFLWAKNKWTMTIVITTINIISNKIIKIINKIITIELKIVRLVDFKQSTTKLVFFIILFWVFYFFISIFKIKKNSKY